MKVIVTSRSSSYQRLSSLASMEALLARPVQIEAVSEFVACLLDLRWDRTALAALVADGHVSLNSAEGAMGMDGACDDFPVPKAM